MMYLLLLEISLYTVCILYQFTTSYVLHRLCIANTNNIDLMCFIHILFIIHMQTCVLAYIFLLYIFARYSIPSVLPHGSAVCVYFLLISAQFIRYSVIYLLVLLFIHTNYNYMYIQFNCTYYMIQFWDMVLDAMASVCCLPCSIAQVSILLCIQQRKYIDYALLYLVSSLYIYNIISTIVYYILLTYDLTLPNSTSPLRWPGMCSNTLGGIRHSVYTIKTPTAYHRWSSCQSDLG